MHGAFAIYASLMDHDGPGDLFAGVVASGLGRLRVGARLCGEATDGRTAKEAALLFIAVGHLAVLNHLPVGLDDSGSVEAPGLFHGHGGGSLLGPVDPDALRLGLDFEECHARGVQITGFQRDGTGKTGNTPSAFGSKVPV